MLCFVVYMRIQEGTTELVAASEHVICLDNTWEGRGEMVPVVHQYLSGEG